MIKVRINHYDKHVAHNITSNRREIGHIVIEHLTSMDIPMEEALNAGGWCELASLEEEFEGTGYTILICS